MKMTYTLEQSLDRLEQIVAQLGNGSLSLDDSLVLYTEAAKLIQECSKKLDSAKLKVEKLFGETSETQQQEVSQ